MEALSDGKARAWSGKLKEAGDARGIVLTEREVAKVPKAKNQRVRYCMWVERLEYETVGARDVKFAKVLDFVSMGS